MQLHLSIRYLEEDHPRTDVSVVNGSVAHLYVKPWRKETANLEGVPQPDFGDNNDHHGNFEKSLTTIQDELWSYQLQGKNLKKNTWA